MGFSEWPKGGDHFNIANDPIAWQVILDSEVPVTVGDETVVKRDLSMTSERVHTILDRPVIRAITLPDYLTNGFRKTATSWCK
jgi:inosine-uridine nucleoside N-ribohydrolase